MKTEPLPTYRPTGDSRQSGRTDALRAYSRDVAFVDVGWFGSILRPTARPTNPRVA